MARVSEVVVGAVFGMLTVVAIGISYSRVGRKTVCYCLCGEVRQVWLNKLGTPTLGCHTCMAEALRLSSVTHGARQGRQTTPTYTSWQSMWKRCTDPNHNSFYYYRDKQPPASWRSFEKFLEDMGERPNNKTLERLDNSKCYSAENCIWADSKVQGRNRSHVKLYTDGEHVLSLREIAVLLGKNYGSLWYQLFEKKLEVTTVLGGNWKTIKKETDATV